MLNSRRHGPWALVAGASEGLGAAFAHEAARRGLHVALIARTREKLEHQAEAIERTHGVETLVLPMDLTASDAHDRAAEALGDRPVGTVIYDAAFSPIGPFLERPLEDALLAVSLNVRGPLAFAHRFGGPMAGRGRGALIIVSSLSGFHGTALVATYAGTKAFGRVFAEGLWDELRGAGVDVLASCPGAVRTPRFQASTDREVGPVMEAEAVASETLDAVGEQAVLVPGRTSRLAHQVMGRLLPREVAVKLMGRSTRKLYG